VVAVVGEIGKWAVQSLARKISSAGSEDVDQVLHVEQIFVTNVCFTQGLSVSGGIHCNTQ
jgi:hypothetical protein